MTTELATQPKSAGFDLSPQTFEQALTFANYLAESDMVPKDFKGKPGNCLIAMQWGNELGLKSLQAIQNIAVINGRPAIWGDAVIALVRSSPACEFIVEDDNGDTATCRVKRRGEPEQSRTFSMQDAKTAGLLGKQGPWSQYPKRMRQMRARGYALRDVFPDVLRGLPIAEEVMDSPKDMGPAHVIPTSEQGASDDLVTAARAAAAQGKASFAKFWNSTPKDIRPQLRHIRAELDQTAADFDAARTVETPPLQTPEPQPARKTLDEVMGMLMAAKNLDALYVAGDWVGDLKDPAEQKIAADKFDEIKFQMEME